MGEARFTPGPWATQPFASGGYIVRDSRKKPVAGLAEHRDISADTRHHNAHLIAAAPDLYAALKGVLGIARAATVHSGGEHNRKRIAAAEAVLAKAENSDG